MDAWQSPKTLPKTNVEILVDGCCFGMPRALYIVFYNKYADKYLTSKGEHVSCIRAWRPLLVDINFKHPWETHVYKILHIPSGQYVSESLLTSHRYGGFIDSNYSTGPLYFNDLLDAERYLRCQTSVSKTNLYVYCWDSDFPEDGIMTGDPINRYEFEIIKV